ncbi:hypothetical protein ERO13_A06G059850v2 [Gossypium hirsutum]|uniref:Uncharacterized protein n=2 Tax=Gossypium TaxID=3633 RepID=A0A5J5VAP7_GOSBA|nr:hypothetical protein ES319_A06G066400v1 [Gossypium barbadense]KAG4194538.1 hypothetical protein ERO13_A06G059850v2 [Gossypium hirsutum]TYJ29373.1 hypothetical protein E1A91_A06G065100v1 [Gossypium mustelinum]
MKQSKGEKLQPCQNDNSRHPKSLMMYKEGSCVRHGHFFLFDDYFFNELIKLCVGIFFTEKIQLSMTVFYFRKYQKRNYNYIVQVASLNQPISFTCI